MRQQVPILGISVDSATSVFFTGTTLFSRMKFFQSLQSQMFPDWTGNYINYESLKELLGGECKIFLSSLHEEMDKANAFYTSKTKELVVALRDFTTKAKLGGATEADRALFSQFYISLNQLRAYVVLSYTTVIKIGEKWNHVNGEKIDAVSMVNSQPFYQSRCLGHLVVRADMLALYYDVSGPNVETEDWTCPVCLDVLNNPVVLDCSHRFCWGCITKAIETNACCPVCRKGQCNQQAQGLQVDVSLSKFLAHHMPSLVEQVCLTILFSTVHLCWEED